MTTEAYFVFVPTIDPDEYQLNPDGLEDLVKDTGLDAATLKHAFIGNGFGCPRRSLDYRPVQYIAEAFTVYGIPHLYSGTEELKEIPVHEARRITWHGETLRIDTGEETLTVSLDRPLVVAAEGKWNDKSMQRNAMASKWVVLATQERAFRFSPKDVVIEGVPEASRFSRVHGVIRLLEEIFQQAGTVHVDSSFSSLKGILGGKPDQYAAFLSLALRQDMFSREVPQKWLSPAVEDETEVTTSHRVYRGMAMWKHEWSRVRYQALDRGSSFVLVFVVCLIAAIELRSPLLFCAGAGALSLGSVLQFFRLMRLRTWIQDLPTSRLRSVSAGFVEISGRIHADKVFISPISGARCVYFRYRKEKKVRTRDGYRWQKVEIGEAFADNCFLNDGTGIISLNLKNAAFMLNTRYKTHHTYLHMLSGVPPMGEDKVRYVEEYLQEGQTVYVMGTATPANPIRLFGQYVSTIKKNPEVMRQYDLNGDGKVDELEWQQAVRELRREFLNHMQNKGQSFSLMMDYHPDTRIFLVSNEKENALLRKLAWRVPAYFAAGLLTFIGFVWILLTIFGRYAW